MNKKCNVFEVKQLLQKTRKSPSTKQWQMGKIQTQITPTKKTGVVYFNRALTLTESFNRRTHCDDITAGT